MRHAPLAILALSVLCTAPCGLTAQTVSQAPPAMKPAPGQTTSTPAGTPALQAPKATVKLPVPKGNPNTPLTPRERALQLISRFTFGPRPGDLEQVIATGPDKWFAQQLNPASIPDAATDKRLGDFPTLRMSAEQIHALFPDRGGIEQVAQAKVPYPNDPLLAAMYEVQVYKYELQQDQKSAAGSATPAPEPTEVQKNVEKARGQAEAARIAGVLFSLPPVKRMAALIAMPVPQRIDFTTYVAGDQKNQILAAFTPREREIFQGMSGNVFLAGNAANELAQAKIVRAILTERQVQEVMTDFWFNHFNVFIGKDSDQWYTTPYERDAIRAHSLGKFKDLLLATATSPAMMVYLDNWLSIGPDSQANGGNATNGKRGSRGLNENYGREVMELHTVGVNGGYTQADVTALSAILTGWTVDRPNQGGPFQFDPKKHQPGAKQWLGQTIPDACPAAPNPQAPAVTACADGMKQGIAALNALAAGPKTAHFISYLIAQRFLADAPPETVVTRMATAYTQTDGDIKAVLQALVTSPEFNSRRYFRTKVKTPMEFVASAFRSTATDPQNPQALVNLLKQMGMPLYNALPPTGYYITADQWMNTGALVDRLNFAYQLTNSKFANQKFDAAHVLALGLMAQPSAGPALAAAAGPHALPVSTDNGAPPLGAAGSDIALHVLEQALIGGNAAPQTNVLIHKQMEQQPAASNPTDTLNLLTALVLGSPDFQLR